MSLEAILHHGPPLPPCPRDTLASLVLREGDGIALHGTWGAGALDVSWRRLRWTTVALDAWLRDRGLRPGDTVALLRLPRTSDTVLAVAWLGLTSLGYRVLFPMYLEPKQVGRWLDETSARAVLWSWQEGVQRSEVDADRRLAHDLDTRGLPRWCLEADVGLPGWLLAPDEEPEAAALAAVRERARDGECTVLTTSGTSGRAHLVRYTQGAWLRSCVAWEAAGFFDPDLLGGRALCLLLGHSMGLRSLVNAMWTRAPLCLVPPEWFLEHPARVRELLIRMRPEHLSGGPSVFRTVLELGRAFPQLKDACLRHLRCAVSIGAAFEPALSRRLEAALRLPLHAGFGMTETLLATCTLLGGDRVPGALGRPLPGVSLRLTPTPSDPELYRLEIRSAFGALGYVGGPDQDWLATGDLVRADLTHAGREREDFIKDGYGVKIDRRAFAERYEALGPPVRHVEPFPLAGEPGLAALVFIEGPVDAEVVQRVRGHLEARNEALRSELEEMEFRHATVLAFGCVSGDPPRTAKGTVACGALLAAHGALVGTLTGPWTQGAGRARLERDLLTRSALARYASPGLGQLLALGRLDLDFVRADGDRVWVRRAGVERELLDLVGGFGGNLLGHRHPDVLAAARRVLDGGGPPLFDQGSAWRAQAELARALGRAFSRRTGQAYVVRLSSTGAEAVEIALAHCWLRWRQRLSRLLEDQRRAFGDREPGAVRRLEEAASALPVPRVFALKGAWHGHSLGARALLDSRKHGLPFRPLLAMQVTWLDGSEDVEAMERATRWRLPVLVERQGQVVVVDQELPSYFASFAEPVEGEGGMVPTRPDLLRQLAGLDVPLVLDEIQCGLGRTGRMPSAPVVGDVYLLAKALGGGVAKIGAVLIERGGWVEDFEEAYASTFAGDRLSCEVASAVVEVILREDVPARAARVGARLREGLERVIASRRAFSAVRGEGLMLGIVLAPGHGFLARALAARERLGLVCAGWLLHRRGLRVLPALSAPMTLRIEPSAFLAEADADRVVRAFDDLAGVLDAGDAAALVDWLVEDEEPLREPPALPPAMDCRLQAVPEGAVRVGFLQHFVDAEGELVAAEPGLGRLSRAALRALFDRFTALCDGHGLEVYGQPLLRGRAWMHGVVLPIDAAGLDAARRSGVLARLTARIQEAVDLMASRGCAVVALGGASSIVTDNGRAVLAPPGVRLTSGNSLTAAIGAARLHLAAGADGCLGILGASGNIGSAVARACVGPGGWRRAVLVGRDVAHLEPLRDLHGEILLTTDVRDLARCDAILTATATPEPLLYPEHLRPGGVAIVDLAIPSPVASSTWADPRARRVQGAGWIDLPDDAGFVQSTITPPGGIFCCAAEALLVALHPEAFAGLPLVGELDPRTLVALERVARAEGLWPGS